MKLKLLFLKVLSNSSDELILIHAPIEKIIFHPHVHIVIVIFKYRIQTGQQLLNSRANCGPINLRRTRRQLRYLTLAYWFDRAGRGSGCRRRILDRASQIQFKNVSILFWRTF